MHHYEGRHFSFLTHFKEYSRSLRHKKQEIFKFPFSTMSLTCHISRQMLSGENAETFQSLHSGPLWNFARLGDKLRPKLVNTIKCMLNTRK